MSDMSIIDEARFQRMGEKEPRRVHVLGSFKVGDCVSCYHCEKGRVYMPGVGVIQDIYPDEERPFVCKHGDALYAYKASEIEQHDFF